MQVTVLQENFKKALTVAEKIIGKNLTLPILNNVLLSAEKSKLRVSSTNLEIGINVWLSGKIEQPGAITLPAHLLGDFINNLPNEKIGLKAKDKKLEIKCQKHRALINGLSADDFPIIPELKEKPALTINGNLLKDGLSQVVNMASISESRPEICGIYNIFNGKSIKLAATDSFRLAEKEIPLADKVSQEQAIIIPQRTIYELIRILSDQESDVSVVVAENQILFDLGNIQIISRLIEGQYPDYQQIIPKQSKTKVTFNKQELTKAIKIASLFSGKIDDVKLAINSQKNIVEVSSRDVDLGENKSQIQAEIQGDSLEAIFNHRYLMDGLNNIYSDKVIIGFNDSIKPVVIYPVGDVNYTYVVMPIRV